MYRYNSVCQNLDDLCRALSDTPDPNPKSVLGRCFRLYFRSQKAAEKFGFVGVGCITFAEARMAEFQRRVLRLKHRIGNQVVVRQGHGFDYDAIVVGYGCEHNGERWMPVYDVKTLDTGMPRWAYKTQVDT